jgi:hypothetical protein
MKPVIKPIVVRSKRSKKKFDDATLNLWLSDKLRGGPFTTIEEPNIRVTQFNEETAEYEIVVKMRATGKQTP